MNSQFVGLPSAQSMVAYPSYPGMLPQAYMPSFQAGMVAPPMANMGATTGAATDTVGHAMTGTETGTSPAAMGGTSAVPNVGQTAVKAASKLAAKKRRKFPVIKKKQRRGAAE